MNTEIEIPVAELKAVLPGFAKVVCKASTLPVLGCLKATQERNGEVKISATNLDEFATVNLGVTSGGSAGDILVSYEELNRIVKTCHPTQTIRLCSSDKETKISYPIGNNQVERNASFVSAKEWPEEPFIDRPAVPISPEVRETMVRAFDCSSEDSSRSILQSAYLDVEDPTSHYVVATNGSVLFSANSFRIGLKESLIVPNRKFLHWSGFLNGDCSVSIQPKTEEKGKARDGWIQFQSNRWTFVTRQIDGQFPKWKQVIPTDPKTHVKLSEDAVKFILNAIPKMPCSDSRHEPIQLVIANGTVSIQARQEDSDSYTTLPVAGAVADGKSVTVSMNRNYLAQAMKLGLSEVELVDELSAVLFKKDGKRMVVMVLRPDKQEPTEPKITTASSETVSSQPPPKKVLEAETEKQILERSSMPKTTATEENQNPTNSQIKKPQTAFEQLQDHMESIRATLKDVLGDLNEAYKLISQAYREKRMTEKEIVSIRESLQQIQRMKI